MRTLKRITLAALAALLCALTCAAQSQDAWVEFAPEGEGFVARMPGVPSTQPTQARAGGLSVSGRRYAAAGVDQATYLVWSLNDPSGLGARLGAQSYVSDYLRDGSALYLDQIAELAWGLLIAPELERLKSENASPEREAGVGMTYRREFEVAGHPAREYLAGLEKTRGTVYISADGPRVYIVAALGADARSPQLKQFVESFGFAPTSKVARLWTPMTMQVDPMLIKPDPRNIPYGLPNSSATPPSSGPGTGSGMGTGTGVGVGQGEGAGVGPGRSYNVGGGDTHEGGGGVGGGDVDYNRTFMQKEVTQKARITYKSEPAFTDSARKFGVTGVVRIRAILAATGEVRAISVVKGLPHGLTFKAVEATRRVKFEPAQKDGHAVSQYIVFEYNFNIY